LQAVSIAALDNLCAHARDFDQLFSLAMAVALIVKTVLILGLMTLPSVYSEDAPKCENTECEKEDVSSLLQSRVHASSESRAEELECTFVAMMEEDNSIGEKDSTDDGYMWGECKDDSEVTHYLFDDDELEKFGPGDKIKLTVSAVSGGNLPTAPNLPWQSDNVPLYRIVSVIAHESALLTEEDHSLTDGATATKEVDVIMMICNYKNQKAFVTDEDKVMNSFYQKLGEKLYSSQGRGSFADMLSASSYGRFTAPRSKGKVVTVTINKNFPFQGCPYNDMAKDCKQATRDQTNFDPDDFTFREFFIPTQGSGCRWGGLANVGCGHYSRIPRKGACHAWYRSDRPFVRAHEIGHNLGFLHAGGDWGTGSQYVEYGDPQASMGASYTFSSFNAASRYQGGFLRKVAGEAVEFQPDFNTGNSGTFKLQSLSKPLGEQGSDAVAVFWSCPKCVPKVSSHSSNVGGNLWLQFRGDEGYSAVTLDSKFQNKVYVHLARKYTSKYYGKDTEMWQVMGKGDSYRPPNSETTVTVEDIVGDLATVTIKAGKAPTTEAPTTGAPGACTDKKSGCPRWAKLYCTGRWSSWMATNCQKSCFAGQACPPPQATWILGQPGKSCTEACESAGKSCSDINLYNVASAEDVQGVAGKAGKTCKNSVGWAYKFSPSICTSSQCCGSGSCTGWCTFGNRGERSCSETTGGHHSRLCPCI